VAQDTVSCNFCGRKTPAARGTCLYCAEALHVARIEVAPPQRQIDASEPAFNTIMTPAAMISEEHAEITLANALAMDREEARAFVSSKKKLPVSRSLTRHEAELVAALVRTCGFGAVIIEDFELMLETRLTRARRLIIKDDHIEVGYIGGTLTLPISSIVLIVVGLVRNQRTDYTEGAASRGKESDVLESFEYRSELILMDVYGPALSESFRIYADGFDYSGLVQPLSYRTELNFQAAAEALAGALPNASFDDDFSRIQPLLARAWPERTRREARGLRRAGATLHLVAQSSLISDNRDQFDRYSRLMFALAK
jgi:hypothetical protein